jgi:hypothetical protein
MQHRNPYRRVLSEQNGYRFHFHRRFLFRPRDSDPVLDFGHPLNTGHRTHDTQRQEKFDHFSNLARNTPQPNPFKVLAAGAFYSYMAAIGMIAASDDALHTVVNYLFSYVVGFVSIFAPQGIGVSEAVYSELASSELPRTQLMIFVAGFRVLVMLSDMLTWLGFMLFKISVGVGAKQGAE